MQRALRSAVAIAGFGLAAAITCGASGCGAVLRHDALRGAPPADASWTLLAARVHAGRAEAVADELETACARGSGASCSALADLIQLGFVPLRDPASARELYVRACGRGHGLACLTLEQRVIWLTLPLLLPRHADAPQLRHARERSGPDALDIDVCIDSHGAPVRVRLRGSTGRDAEDYRLARAASDWRFEPLAVEDPRSLAACDRFVVAL